MENESFEELYNESLKRDAHLEKVMKGKVIRITNSGEVHVDLGYKADGIIPKNEFSFNENDNPENELKIGDVITVEVLKKNDGIGNVLLSYKRTRIAQEREKLQELISAGEVFHGKINQINEKGIVTEIYGTRVFIPISLSGIRRNDNLDSYKGKEIEFEIIEFDPENKKVIGSNKIITDRERKMADEAFWSNILDNKEYTGKVASVNSYGVFVDLGGAQGLLHISEITWKRNANANDYFKVGQEVKVYVKNLDKENKKIQLGYSEKEISPWESIDEKYKAGDVVKGTVKRLATFGAFVELEEGIEGLVHISQISEERISKVEQVLEVGQSVDVKIMSIDEEKNKLELSIKEVHSDDWKNEITNIDGVTFDLKK